MKRLDAWLGISVLALSLLGCGGGGSAGTSVFSPSGGASGPTASASDLVISLSKSQVNDAGGDSVTATVTALDSNRNAVSGVPVTVSVDSDAIVQVSGATSDTNGKVTATVSPGSNPANRAVTITATSGSVTRTTSFQVTGAQITSTIAPSTSLQGGQSATITYTLQDRSGNVLAGQSISVTGDGIPSGSGTTDGQGQFAYTFTAPSVTGSLTVTALAAGYEKTDTLQVATSSTPPPVTTPVLSAAVTANPTVVSVNQNGSTSNQVQVQAKFTGANNSKIPYVRVRFDLDGDPNTVGGTFSSGADLVYSDANGLATVSYIPGEKFSPTNGVTIRACWDYNDFAAGTCPNQATYQITVVSAALTVSIGTDNLIGSGPQTYTKDYVVVVTDSAGQAVQNVVVTPSLDLTAFYKGDYAVSGSAWTQNDVTGDGPYVWDSTSGKWVDHFGDAGTIPACPNEDENRNGVLEANEDLNQNGKLDPSGVTITALDSSGNPTTSAVATDAGGLMHVRIQYAQNLATWVDYKITVTAKVAGTEGKAVYAGNLPAPAIAFTTTTSSPPFVLSPYGTHAGCTNAN